MALSISFSELRELSLAYTNKTGYPFSEFSISFLKRQLSKYCEKYHIRRLQHFYEQIENKIFVESLLYFLSVDTSEMFRDPSFWRMLVPKVFPKLNADLHSIWFPDASSGEEIASLLILLKLTNNLSNISIEFNHPSRTRIEEINSGIIKTNNISLFQTNFKRLEFDESIDSYINLVINSIFLNPNLVNNIKGQKGWFLTPPLNSPSIIFFRNSMLYFSKTLQNQVALYLFEKLKPGGFLMLGIKENIPESIKDKMIIIDENERIFQKPGVLMPLINE